MSSTIHSFGPKSARGLSAEVCWVDTSALVSPRGVCLRPNSGYLLKHLSSGPACPVSPLTQDRHVEDANRAPTGHAVRLAPDPAIAESADVAAAGEQDADRAGEDRPAGEHDRTDPLRRCVFIGPARCDHDLG